MSFSRHRWLIPPMYTLVAIFYFTLRASEKWTSSPLNKGCMSCNVYGIPPPFSSISNGSNSKPTFRFHREKKITDTTGMVTVPRKPPEPIFVNFLRSPGIDFQSVRYDNSIIMLQFNATHYSVSTLIYKIQQSTVSKLLKNKYSSQLSLIRAKIQLTAPPVNFHGVLQSFSANRASYASQAVSVLEFLNNLGGPGTE